MTTKEWQEKLSKGAKEVMDVLFPNEEERKILDMPLRDLIDMKLLYDYLGGTIKLGDDDE